MHLLLVAMHLATSVLLSNQVVATGIHIITHSAHQTWTSHVAKLTKEQRKNRYKRCQKEKTKDSYKEKSIKYKI